MTLRKKKRSRNFTGRNGGCYTSQKVNVLVLRPEMSKHFNCKICKLKVNNSMSMI